MQRLYAFIWDKFLARFSKIAVNLREIPRLQW